MKIDKRIIQAIGEYNAKAIKIKKETYNALKEETKKTIKMAGVKIIFDNTVKGFQAIF